MRVSRRWTAAGTIAGGVSLVLFAPPFPASHADPNTHQPLPPERLSDNSGESLCTADADARRGVVNAFVRDGGGVFDSVLDFDAVVRDPAHPSRILPAYDSGDDLHPGDAGLQAMAESIDPRKLTG